MKVEELISLVRSEGIQIEIRDGKLWLSMKPSQSALDLLSQRKTEVLDYLARSKEPARESAPNTELRSDALASSRESQGQPFKSYKFPEGTVVDLTREEFGDIVEVFRLLHEQQLKLEHEGRLESIGYREVVLRTEGEGESSNSE